MTNEKKNGPFSALQVIPDAVGAGCLHANDPLEAHLLVLLIHFLIPVLSNSIGSLLGSLLLTRFKAKKATTEISRSAGVQLKVDSTRRSSRTSQERIPPLLLSCRISQHLTNASPQHLQSGIGVINPLSSSHRLSPSDLL